MFRVSAQIGYCARKSERIFRDRTDPLASHDDILYEHYRFSAEGRRYICNLLEPYIGSATKRSRALTVAQTVCVSLRFFATGTYMHSVGDAENLIRILYAALFTRLYLLLLNLLT